MNGVSRHHSAIITAMTAVSLFDVLVGHGAGTPAAPGDLLTQFAGSLVAAALADFERLREYEQQFATARLREPVQELERDRVVWRLYAEWADEAEQVLDRARARVAGGAAIEGLDRLDDVIGRTRARLSVTPEQIARGREQARQGQFVPAKGLRDELHARLRA
jgi:hypothetical protein